MALSPGMKIGPYDIVAPIGSGGMGDVYRARDGRLNRDVAIKVLPPAFATDRERLLRFEREARATASLNDPNIVAIYDVGAEKNAPYIVSELLEGVTLRHKIVAGALTSREASKYAAQIAHGLSAAHAKGVVHRDLKPENVFITQTGIAKILDFGIAKLTQPDTVSGNKDDIGGENQSTLETKAGVVLGTAGYMSPEQIRNSAVDYRSDIFSFGAILFEMFSGKRAFTGRTAADTVSAILRDEPLELAEKRDAIPRGIQRIIRHCLEKEPEKRYQSTSDLVFDLEEMSGLQYETAMELPLRAGRKTWFAVGVAVIAAAVLAAILFSRPQAPRAPVYQRLTFLRGTVWSARFSPDGQTILYSASWNGTPMNVFTTRAEGIESRSMGLDNAQLLAISPFGRMSILVKRKYLSHHLSLGTLAEVSSLGGTPREILDDVQEADWAPNGADLAVVRDVAGRSRLEFPAGKLLYQPDGWISYPRVSPNGDRIAFMEHPVQGDSRGWVSVINLHGKRTILSGEWAGEEGLAWSPDGQEIWFTANKSGGANSLFAVSMTGTLRTLATAPVNLILLDVHNDNVLVSSGNESSEFFAFDPGGPTEHDISWLDWGAIRDLSPDGRTLIFTHFGEKSGKNYSVYLRQLDSPTAVRLGDGSGWAISPDGKQVISILADPAQIMLLPTGAGQVEKLPSGGIEEYGLGANWFPDGKKIVFIAHEHNHASRTYLQDISGGKPEPLVPEGVAGTLLSSDGKYLIAADAHGNQFMFPVAGGPPQSIPGLTSGDKIVRFSGDGRSLFVLDNENASGKIYRVDLGTGRRELWRALNPADPAGIREFNTVLLTPDGKYYVYGLTRSLTTLYLTQIGR